MKSPMWLLKCLLEESGKRCSTQTARDWKTIERRFEHEGLSFLTITLPAFCTAFESWLEEGRICPLARTSFKTRKGYCCPDFMSGMLGQVFDLKSGLILPVRNVDAIRCIRQLLLVFKRLEIPCSDGRMAAAVEKYVSTEEELRKVAAFGTQRIDHSFEMVSSYLWSQVLAHSNQAVSDFDLPVRHGTGATADRISGNQKFVTRYWHERLDTFFPIDTYGFTNVNHVLDEEEGINTVRVRGLDEEDPVRVVFVPKTLKTPRVIAMEPVVMQYVQQGVMNVLVRDIQSHPLTRGKINFSNQGVNRGLALRSSKDGFYATLDLSEASDRVLADFVWQMLGSVPVIRDAIRACRSGRARLPDARIIELGKFASMGSALCFPIEAMMFFTIIVATRVERRADQTGRLFVCKDDFEGAFVYGDDIIVPVDEVDGVGSALARYGLALNKHKCFSKGNFRESCGMDAYDGQIVKPIRLNRLFPTDKQQASEVASLVSFHNQLEEAGWLDTARLIRVEFSGPLRIPFSTATSPVLGWVTHTDSPGPTRWNKDLHRIEVFGPVLRPKRKPDELEGYSALHKWFIQRGDQPIQDMNHLLSTVRPGTVTLQFRWGPT